MNKVVHIIAIAETPKNYPFSGAENHLFELMIGQRQAGWDVTLVLLVRVNGPIIENKIAELQAHGIHVLTVPERSRNISYSAWYFMTAGLAQLVKILRARRHSVIHLHLSYAAHLGRVAALLAGCRNIIESIHNDEPFFMEPSWRARLALFRQVTRHYIAISHRVKNHYAHAAGLKDNQITVVHYGITPRTDFLPRDEARRALNLPADAYIIGFVGRFTEQKNLPLLLDAMTELPDCHLALIGTGDDEKELKDLAAQLGITSRLHFLGHRQNAAQYMKAFDVFCLPSRWEGLGLVLLEAMQANVPIVASRAGAIPEILGDGKYGMLFESGNQAELVAALKTVKLDPSLAARLTDAAHLRLTDYHTIRRMVEETIGVYGKI